MIERLKITNEDEAGQKKRKEILDIRGEYEGDSAVKDAIDVISGRNHDFALLQSIFSRRQLKSGVEERLRMRDLLVIHLTAEQWMGADLGRDTVMAFFVDGGIVVVNDENVKEQSRAMNIDIGVLVTHLFIHEFSHAVGHTSQQIVKTKSGVWMHQRVGIGHELIPGRERNEDSDGDILKEETPDTRKSVRLFEFIYEAINDKFAEEVTYEFVSASGHIPRGQLDRFYKLWNAPGSRHGQERRLLKAVIDRITLETGVPEEVVWDSLKSAAIQGVNLIDRDENKRTILDQAVGEGFTEELAFVNNLQQLSTLLVKYGLESAFEKFINNAKFWIDRYVTNAKSSIMKK